jgi:hypothetical protein
MDALLTGMLTEGDAAWSATPSPFTPSSNLIPSREQPHQLMQMHAQRLSKPNFDVQNDHA